MNALPDQPTPDRTDHTQVAAPPAPRDTSPPAARRSGLAFTEPDGPVVVICGLHGGAGTSTLALLLAHYAAAASSVPVLLCEAPGASGNQLALGAPESAVSLDSLAVTLAIGARPQDGWWAQRGNLRMLATPPAPLHAPAGADLCGTLRAAAREHGLTVVDGGSVRDHSTRALLGCATHVIWTLSIQPGTVEQARAVLASGLVPVLAAAQAFALRTDRRSAALTRAVRDLRRVAESHGARQLLLLPYDPVLATRPVELHSDPLHRPLSSLTRFLQSP